MTQPGSPPVDVFERSKRIESMGKGLSETFAELERLRADAAKKQLKIHELGRKLTVALSDAKKGKRDYRAAMDEKKGPTFIATDEEWLFARQAEWKFKSDPSGRRSLLLRCRGRKRILIRADVAGGKKTTLVRQAVLMARERERGR